MGDMDLEEAEKMKYQDWLSSMIQSLNDQRDEFEADGELLGNKKSLSGDEKSKLAQLKSNLERHSWHIKKLELILRALDNDAIDMTDLVLVRESVEYYLEAHGEVDYQHDETLYDAFDLTEFEEKTPVIKPRTPSSDAVKDSGSNAGNSKEEL